MLSHDRTNYVPSSIDSGSESNETIEVELTLEGSKLSLLEESKSGQENSPW